MTSSKNNRWKIVFGGFVPGELVVGFTLSSISALMFKISSDLSLTEFQTALILSTFPMAMVLFGIISGSLADHFGIVRMNLFGLTMATLFLFARFFANDFISIFLFSLLSSIGVAFIVPTLTKLVSTLFERDSQGLAVGVLSISYRFGAASILFAIPPLLQLFSNNWNLIFLLGGLFGTSTIMLFLYSNFKYDFSSKIPSPKNQDFSVLFNNIKFVLSFRLVLLITCSRFFQGGFLLGLSAFLPYLLQYTGSSLEDAALISGSFWACQSVGSFLLPNISDRFQKRSSLLLLVGSSSIIFILPLFFYWGNFTITLLSFSVLGLIFAGITEVMWLIPLSDPNITSKYIGSTTGLIMTAGSSGGIITSLLMGQILELTSDIYFILIFLLFLSVIMIITHFLININEPPKSS